MTECILHLLLQDIGGPGQLPAALPSAALKAELRRQASFVGFQDRWICVMYISWRVEAFERSGQHLERLRANRPHHLSYAMSAFLFILSLAYSRLTY